MPQTFATSKISRNCQTVIPKRVRRVLGLVEGSVIRYERDGVAMRITRLDVGEPNPFVNSRQRIDATDDFQQASVRG